MRFSDIFKLKAEVDESKIVNLDDVIEALTRDQQNGVRSYYDYMGVRLYSDNIGPDSAYQQVYGKTKEAYQQEMEEQKRKNWETYLEMEKRIANIEERAPEIVERGKKLIFPERHEAWEEYVNKSVHGLYRGYDAEVTLTILEELATSKTMDEVLADLKNNPDTAEYDRVSATVFQFSDRGPEFLERTLPPDKLTTEVMLNIESKKEENAELSKRHSKNI